MDASMLEETIQNPNPYPIVADILYDDIWQLCLQARDLSWDPVRVIDWGAMLRCACCVLNTSIPVKMRVEGSN